jgi:hypothetical protein
MYPKSSRRGLEVARFTKIGVSARFVYENRNAVGGGNIKSDMLLFV